MEYASCSSCLLKSKAVGSLGENELHILGRGCVQAVFKKGETIFKENALSSNIIYLQTGLVKLMIDGTHRMQILKIEKAPCYLGLPTTVGDKINHYSAVALEKTTACFVDMHVFKELLKISPDFSYEIIVELCKNELDLFNKYVKLTQNQVYGRLATHLLCFSNEIYLSDEFKLPLKRKELADLICTSRETISRQLTELAEENIIQIKGKNIRILKKHILEEISKKG